MFLSIEFVPYFIGFFLGFLFIYLLLLFKYYLKILCLPFVCY